MCVLCGELTNTLHWSDENFKAHKSEVVVGENQRERMRHRLNRAKLANEILAFYGLNLKEWQGSKFILADKKGQSVIVNDLGDLWHKAETLYKSPLDPLDPRLLMFLKNKNG